MRLHHLAVVAAVLLGVLASSHARAPREPGAGELDDADIAGVLDAMLPQSDAAQGAGPSLSRMNGAIRWLVRALNATRNSLRQTESRLRAEIALTKATLSQALARETLRAKAAEARLTPLWMARSINATAARNDRMEQARAISAEQSLGVVVRNASTLLSARDAALDMLISSEAQRAMVKEASIQSNVDDEVARARLAEAELASAIGNETSRAMGVEGSLLGTLTALSTCPANAEGAPNCACARGTTGTLTWAGTLWTGTCTIAPCPANSNGAPSCTCSPGHAGSLTWTGSAWAGTCSVVPCPANAAGSPASCTCGVGYTGTVSWTGASWSGGCTAAACPANAAGAPNCACVDGFAGNLTWSDSAWQGTCTPSVPSLISMASGRLHSCAILASGRVRCWGSDSNGQLGLGFVSGSIAWTPAAQVSGENRVKIAVSDAHTCALNSYGDLSCWGIGESGRLGVAIQQTGAPQFITGNVKDVSAGERHTCAVYNDGTLRCWGRNNRGQLGNSGPDLSTVPADAVLTGVKQVSCGIFSTCAVHDNGALTCFGQSISSEPGFSSTSGNIGAAGKIACGASHCCAVIADNNHPASMVRCWGNRFSGQLGDGSIGQSNFVTFETGQTISFVSSSVVSVASGSAHTCVSLADGTVRCWGSNSHGQLGIGSDADTSGAIVTPAITNVKAVFSSATSLTTCASLTTGGFKCWGANDFGQTGLGPDAPAKVTAPSANAVFP